MPHCEGQHHRFFRDDVSGSAAPQGDSCGSEMADKTSSACPSGDGHNRAQAAVPDVRGRPEARRGHRSRAYAS
eukprot:5188452-Pyramimonas_sp.AAC.1